MYAKEDRYIVNGAHDCEKLQNLLDGFIKRFVLCPKCDNPETKLVSLNLYDYRTKEGNDSHIFFMMKTDPWGRDENNPRKMILFYDVCFLLKINIFNVIMTCQ